MENSKSGMIMQTATALSEKQTLIRHILIPSVTLAILISTVITSAYYGLLVVLMGGIRMANAQLSLYGPWMVVLLIGFSLQLTLFFYQRRYSRYLHTACTSGKGQMAASSGTTGVAMLACCAHHLAEILPFIGIGAAGAILGRYQFQFIELGIASNLIGILFLLSAIQKHRLFLSGAEVVFARLNFSWLMKLSMFISAGYLTFSVIRSFS